MQARISFVYGMKQSQIAHKQLEVGECMKAGEDIHLMCSWILSTLNWIFYKIIFKNKSYNAFEGWFVT